MKQLFNIRSEGAKEMIQPVLSIRVGEHHCSFSITNYSAKELSQLVYYAERDISTETLDKIVEAHPELRLPFYLVNIGYDYPQSTLVPMTHFKAEDASSWLQTMGGSEGNQTIISELIPEWQIYNIYAVPKKIHDWMVRNFTTARYWHSYSVSIKKLVQAEENGVMNIDLRPDDFTLIASKGNKLLLAQRFFYSTPEDVIYYLLKTCEQIGLSPTELQLNVSGLLDQSSALYRELYQYFVHIQFRETEWNIPVSYVDDNPNHFFTSLNDLAQCAL